MAKVIYIFNGRLPTEKAHGLQVMKTCEAFAAISNNFEVELIVPYRRNPINDDAFKYYGVKRVFKIKNLWSLDPMAIKWFPEQLAFWVQSFTSGISIILYLLTHRYPRGTIFYARDYVSLFILSFLGFDPVAEIHDYRSSAPRSFVNFIIKKSRKIVTNSEGTLNLLRSHYEMLDSKILIAPNGVDINFFNVPETPEEARKLLNMPLGKIIMGYVGRLETVGKEKGVSTLINAVAKLDPVRVMLYIVGGPDELVSKYRSQYSDLRDLVLVGHVEYKKIPLYLRAIDVVVIPMLDDQHAKTTSPIKLFEFLAAGKTIVASDLPALRSYLNESNALFFKTGDVEDLATKINRILSEPELKERLSAKAKLDAKQHSWLNRASKILNSII